MRRDHVIFELLLGLMFGLFANAVCMGQTVDTNTQRHDMHSCPLGQFVTGVHVDNNLLLCTSEFGAYSASQEIVDRNTQEQGMHACPEGMAMTGYHHGRNLLACAPVARPPIPKFVDTGTQRFGMHACPEGDPVSGINDGRGLLLCGTSSTMPTGEFADAGTQRHDMHSCPLGQFVTGVHVDNNLLLCSNSFGSYSLSQEVVDSSTQSYDMHACPEGMAMTGYHHGRNLLACAPVARPPIPKFVDTGTQRFGMHACPEGDPVSGINDGRGLLLCGTQSGLRIQSFKASPNDGYIGVGDSATLTWQVSGCEVNCSVSLQGREGLGNLVLDMPYVPPTGSQQVIPRFNTTYTLTAITTGGDRDSREKEVRLYGGTPTGSLFYFKMTNPQSWVTPCFTIAIYAPDQTTAKKRAEDLNGGYTATPIDASQVATCN